MNGNKNAKKCFVSGWCLGINFEQMTNILYKRKGHDNKEYFFYINH